MGNYYKKVYPFNAVATAVSVLTDPIDISHLDKYAILFQNDNTGIAFDNLIVQASLDSHDPSAADAAQNWVTVNSAIIPVPSALGATAAVLTSAINNSYRYLRFLGNTSATVSFNTTKVTIAGFGR